jgi:anti-sigma factor (TIGR02949 family)
MNETTTDRLKQMIAQNQSEAMTSDDQRCMQQKNDCLEMLANMIDGQATETEQNNFVEHIQECMPCFKKYKLEAAIKEVLQQKIEKKSLPCDLIDCIKSKIQEIPL